MQHCFVLGWRSQNLSGSSSLRWFNCSKTFLLLPQYLTLCSWPSYFTVTTPLCCYHNIWHCVLDFHILLWQHLSVVTTIFDIVFLTFIFYYDTTFMLLPQYLTLCSWPSYFTVTTPLCCYHNIWHCVLDIHILLWKDLFCSYHNIWPCVIDLHILIFTLPVFSATIHIRKILTFNFRWSDMRRCNGE